MYTLFVSLIIIASVLMIIIVLIQESKGGGLSSNFSSSNQIMGVRKTTDIVEKATWGLAIAMVVFSILCSYVAPEANTMQQEIYQTTNQAANPANLPGFDGAKAQQPKAEAPAAAPAAETPAELAK